MGISLFDAGNDVSVPDDQWRAIQALANESTIICLADPDQRIFDHLPGVDEARIQQAVDTLWPRPFDLSKDNHRSPGQCLLAYANAVLRNDRAVPVPDNLTFATYSGNQLGFNVHHYLIALRQHLLARFGSEPADRGARANQRAGRTAVRGSRRRSTAVVRTVLANRMIEANPQESAATTTFMSMYKSKSKEFDGVIIAETRFGNDQLIDFTKGAAEIQKRRRLLRVAITRARHHVVIVRPRLQRPLIS